MCVSFWPLPRVWVEKIQLIFPFKRTDAKILRDNRGALEEGRQGRGPRRLPEILLVNQHSIWFRSWLEDQSASQNSQVLTPWPNFVHHTRPLPRTSLVTVFVGQDCLPSVGNLESSIEGFRSARQKALLLVSECSVVGSKPNTTERS